MDRTHIFLVESPCMDHQSCLFLGRVLIMRTVSQSISRKRPYHMDRPPVYFWKKAHWVGSQFSDTMRSFYFEPSVGLCSAGSYKFPDSRTAPLTDAWATRTGGCLALVSRTGRTDGQDCRDMDGQDCRHEEPGQACGAGRH